MDPLTQAADTIIEKSVEAALPAVESMALRRIDDTRVATTRYVFETERDTVIKVPHRENLIEINEREAKAWENCKDETLIAPVVDYHDEYKWIEMKRCRRFHPTKARDRSYKSFTDKLANSDWQIGDVHMDNIGILPANNEIVSFDYPDMERKV